MSYMKNTLKWLSKSIFRSQKRTINPLLLTYLDIWGHYEKESAKNDPNLIQKKSLHKLCNLGQGELMHVPQPSIIFMPIAWVLAIVLLTTRSLVIPNSSREVPWERYSWIYFAQRAKCSSTYYSDYWLLTYWIHEQGKEMSKEINNYMHSHKSNQHSF
jgi:hypothetical protein